MSGKAYPITLDGRYFVVRGRLWRRSDPRLAEADRRRLVDDLMAARRAVHVARTRGDDAAEAAAHAAVDVAKTALGERGAVWWDDGAPDFNRRLVRTTPYADWFASAGEAVGALAASSGACAGVRDLYQGETINRREPEEGDGREPRGPRG